MPVHIDLPHSAPAQSLTKVLAEAALQRQNILLGTDRESAPPAAPVSAESDHVTLSPQAQQRLDAQAQQPQGQGAGLAGNTSNAAGAASRALPVVALPLSQTMPLPEGADPAPPPLPPPLPPPAGPVPAPAAQAGPASAAASALVPNTLVAAAPSSTTASTGTTTGAAASPAATAAPAPMLTLTAAPAPALSGAAARAAALQTPWPAQGVSGPLRSLVTSLVQQLTAAALPQRVVGIQAWPMALAQALDDGQTPAPSAALAQPASPAGSAATLPALQTWLVHHGQVQTPEGPRGFSLSLRVPAQWLPSQETAPQGQASPQLSMPAAAGAAMAQAVSGSAGTANFEGASQTLQSGAFALVLQSPGPSEARISALLMMDFQPLPPASAQATVYGRDMLQPRQDPWLQMAVLQASGQVPRDEEKAHLGSELCDTPDCPYVGRAACVQPFCMAMRSVLPVSTVPAESFISHDRHPASTAA